MSLVKWIRRNNRKIMVVVIIVAMISFVIGSYGLKIISNMINPRNPVIATYDDGKHIKNDDIIMAQNELQVLRMLNGDQLLAVQGPGGALLCDLIFPDSPVVSDLAAQFKQAVQRGQLDLDMDALEAYFNQPAESAAVVWILLKAEAQRAGYLVSSANATNLIKAMVAQTTQGKGSAAQLVKAVMQKSGMTEQQIVRVFGDLLTVSDYANRIMNSEAVTLNQVKASLGRSAEKLDAEYVKIDAEALIDENAAFSDADINAQFEAYKQNDAGVVTEDNPFGFGYKLPKRIQLEYMIVLANDVKAKVEAPTNAEMDRYYRNNITQFQTQEPSDPNNPDSEKITKTKSFTEVERQIRSSIERQKTSTMTSMIMNEMKDITEKRFGEVNFEEATNAQLQEAAEEYTYDVAAKQIADAQGITITTGKTGWLSAADFQNEKILRSLSRQQGQARLPLSELAFVASPEPKQKHRIGLPAIRVWQNIGPVTGGYYDAEASEYHAMTALVRVVGIEEAAVPADVNVEYDTQGVALFETKEDKEKASFSLKDKVIEDLRLKKAMNVAIQRGNELVQLIKNSDWSEAVKAYNDKHAPGSNDPNNTEASELAIKIELANDQTRTPATEIKRIKQYMAENPGMAPRIQQMLATDTLNNQLYALLEEGTESTGTISKVMPLEAAKACYVVKDVTRQTATEKDYLDGKVQTAMQLSMKDNARLAMAHFSTENIIKRMNFAYKKKTDETAPEGDAATDTSDDTETE